MSLPRTTLALIATVATFASGTGAALACGGPDMAPGGLVHASKVHHAHSSHHAHAKHHAKRG